MDVDSILNLEKRTGVKDVDIDDFLRKAAEVEKAVKGLAQGTLRPEEIKIEGIESEEEKHQKEINRQKRLEEQRKKAEELRQQRKAEEKDRWWAGSEMFAAKVSEEEGPILDDYENENQQPTSAKQKLLKRYTADYSRWDEWVPADPATKQEEEERQKDEERIRNTEFENNNQEFCEMFTKDMEERNKSIKKKQESSEILRLKGNRLFKAKDYNAALGSYMEALKLTPYEAKTLLNIAQVHIKNKDYEDALEFLARTICMDPKNIKALSRKAFVLSELGRHDEALISVKKALVLEPGNAELIAQNKDIELIIREAKEEEDLRELTLSLTRNSAMERSLDLAPALPLPARPHSPSLAASSSSSSSSTAATSDAATAPSSSSSSSSSANTNTASKTPSSSTPAASPKRGNSNTIDSPQVGDVDQKQKRLAAGFELISWLSNQAKLRSTYTVSVLPQTEAEADAENKSSRVESYRTVLPIDPQPSNDDMAAALAWVSLTSGEDWPNSSLQRSSPSPPLPPLTTTPPLGGATATTSTAITITVFDVCAQLVREDQAYKVYVRTSGALAAILGYVKLALDSEDPPFLGKCLDFIADAVAGERSSKMLLLENSFLSSVKGALLAGSSKNGGGTKKLKWLPTRRHGPAWRIDLLHGAVRVIHECCRDDTCPKARSAICTDKTVIPTLGNAIGELIFELFPLSSNNNNLSTASLSSSSSLDSASAVALSPEVAADISAFIITSAQILRDISFSDSGHAVCTAEAGPAVIALAAALHVFVCTPLLVKSTTEKGEPMVAQVAKVVVAEVTEAIIEALVGLSQTDGLRPFYAVPVPFKSPALGTAPTIITPAHAVISTATAFPVLKINCLAILMNASLENAPSSPISSLPSVYEGGIRKAIIDAGGLEIALTGIRRDKAQRAKDLADELDGVELARYAGLLARLAVATEVQEQLRSPTLYRLLVRSIGGCRQSGIDSDTVSLNKWEIDERGHLIRTLAGLPKPSEETLAIALEERLAEALLAVFPRPREELHKITPQSVTLPPAQPAPAILLGNAARCLMPLADSPAHANIIYETTSSSRFLGIERLICAMATCSDIRVRRNIAILLAKGCRLPGVRERVEHLRGLQMIVELQDKL